MTTDYLSDLMGQAKQTQTEDNFEFINVDDSSSSNEIEKGKEICKRHNIVFLENKDRGVQWAVQTLIDYIREQSNNNFTTMSQYITNLILDDRINKTEKNK